MALRHASVVRSARRARADLRERVRRAALLLGLASDRPARSRRRARPGGQRVRHGVLAAIALLARATAFAVGTAAGAAAILTLVVVLGRPALLHAAGVVDMRLDVPANAALPQLEQRSVIYAADGSRLAIVDREVSRKVIPLRDIPRRVRQAVISAEDRKFWRHDGYDIEGMGRALVANIRAGGVAEGGSTITQQLAKSEVGTERTLERKVNELLYAVALEEEFSKRELLARYLNQVYFGARAYGVAAAAEEFFGTTPRQLRVDQAALLASMIPSPNSADPRDRPRIARARRNAVLRAMAAQGYLRRKELRGLLKRPLGVVDSPERRRRQPHVVDAVQREFLGNPVFGDTRQERRRRLYYGGLRIRTTLEPRLQAIARQVIDAYLPADAPTAAVATVEPATGEIKAIQSGLDYRRLEYDLPTQGRRQPGSAFKPFVYAAALQQGFPLGTRLEGNSPAYFEGVRDWERDPLDPDAGVENYGGADFARLHMREALTNSVNTATAQLTLVLGQERVAELAGRMGVDIGAATNGIINPSMGLGGLERGATPLELASAYAVFANGGRRVQPHLIASVSDATGRVIYEAPGDAERVLSPVVNAAMVDLMRDVVDDGTGTAAQLPGWEVAGKTGTTTSNVDAWFVGYTPVLSTAVWVGHAEGQIEMPGMTGGSLPATMWNAYMSQVLAGRAAEPFPELDLERLNQRVNGRAVAVPHVVGKTQTAALRALLNHRLIGQAVEQDSGAPDGTVIWQTPRGGGRAPKGSRIYIGVSNGQEPAFSFDFDFDGDEDGGDGDQFFDDG